MCLEAKLQKDCKCTERNSILKAAFFLPQDIFIFKTEGMNDGKKVTVYYMKKYCDYRGGKNESS